MRKIIIIAAWSANHHMLSTICFILCMLLLGSSPLVLYSCAATDTLTTGSLLSDHSGGGGSGTLISAGGRFELGFFAPPPGHRRYIGIWYHMSVPPTVVWVANRDKPLTADRTGIFTIAEDDGNLKVLDGSKNTYFSTNLTSSPSSGRRTVKLLDSGNLVLSDHDPSSGGSTSTVLWQSFDHPTDTFLPGMKMDENLKLTSWTTDDDPRSGDFTFKKDELEAGENHYKIIWNETKVYWKTGETSSSFITSSEMPFLVALLLSNFSKQTIHKSSSYQWKPVHFPQYYNINYTQFSNYTRLPDYNNTRILMNSSGTIQFLSWDNDTTKGARGWSLIWSEPRDQCSVYNACGNFGSCNSNRTSPAEVCKCLAGFEPRWPDNWNSGDFSNGCTWKTPKPCDNNTEFLNLTMMKVGKPDLPVDEAESKEACREACVADCNCEAYSYNNDTRRGSTSDSLVHKCWIWTSELKNLQEEYVDGGHNLSVRVVLSDTVGNPKQEGGSPNKKTSLSLKAVVIFAIVIVVVLIFCIVSYISYNSIKNQEGRESRERIQGNPVLHLYDSERQIKDLIDSGQFEEDDKKGIDVPFFDLESILVATNNFSDENKLGQGGFGLVYKGKFPGGQEIAIKRLSSHSVQGLDEFKNEVVLIAKLQHRNLVRLLGYCIKGFEKILLYEYMPNKSLDTFIFDRTLCMLLNWEKRFDIILGIARGLLYLHQDSRLRIIHRDLKTSNILLDEEMNPRVSDFGLARIVGGKEMEANTNKVVGTYGYMSPEYALEGLFSIKSDVFSFGVVVLEIISGKKNTGFYQSQQTLNLLGYAWRLWKEEKALNLMDHTLLESCNTSDVLKCIIIGLLCVQEDPGDRPTMSNVVFMLGSETATLPNPKQPVFITRKCNSSTPSSSSSKPAEARSTNELTVSMEEGR